MSKILSKSFIIDDNWFNRFDAARGLSPEKYILTKPGDILVAEQLACYPKAIDKFPNWHLDGMLYSKLALEQSSGEVAAQFKSHIAKGAVLWDLTGGLGIDSLAFSNSFREVNYCEPDDRPYSLAKYNHNLHGATNIKHHNFPAEIALEHIDHTDWIFLDPSRRDHNNKKILLEDSQPNILELISRIIKKCNSFMIKLSPMYDIKQLCHELPVINQVVVVSVGGEVKEILGIFSPDFPKKIKAVLLPANIQFEKDFESFKKKSIPLSSSNPHPGAYLHVADPAIFKSDMLSIIAKSQNLKTWGQGGYVWSEKSELQGFNSYKIQEIVDFKPKMLKKLIAGKKVNIHKRNFPLEISSVYKTLNTSMGDDYHLFLTAEPGNKKRVCITHPANHIIQP
jgi:hypothetical protein